MLNNDDEDVSDYYGVVPTIAGLLIGIGITVFMFVVADGFTH